MLCPFVTFDPDFTRAAMPLRQLSGSNRAAPSPRIEVAVNLRPSGQMAPVKRDAEVPLPVDRAAA